MDLSSYTPEGVVVSMISGQTVPLDGSTLRGTAAFSAVVPGLRSVAFSLVSDKGEVLETDSDDTGPSFDFPLDSRGNPQAFNTAGLEDGTYALLVTMSLEDDEVMRRAARFEVANSLPGAGVGD